MPIPLLHRLREVSDKPWSGFSATDYTPQQWRAAYLLDTGEGGPDSKDRFKLPVKEPSGALNRNGVHAAAAVLAGGRGGVQASPDAKRAAAKKLIGLYRSQLNEDPPPALLSAAGAGTGKKEAAGPAAAAGTVELVEATTGAMQPAGDHGGRRRYRARLIEGDRWGSSGYYSRQVLERDGPAVWPAGTPMFLDHPGAAESVDRPERSVRDLAGRIVSTPRYDGDGLYADIEVYPHQQPIVDALAEAVGLSIRAQGTAEQGEADGRTGPIVTSLRHGHSVDFVTVPGAGGRLVEVLESLRATPLDVAEAGSIGAWVESRLHLALTQICDDMYGCGQLTREERIALSKAVGDGLDQFSQALTAAAPQLYQRSQYGGDADMTPEPVSGAPTSGGPLGEASTDLYTPTSVTTASAVTAAPIFIRTAAATAEPLVPAHPSTVEESMSKPTAPDEGGQAGTAATETTTVTEAAPAPTTTQAAPTLVLPPEIIKQLEEAQRVAADTAAKVAQLEQERDAALTEARRGRAVEALRAQATTALSESGLPAATHPRVIDTVCAAPPLTATGDLDGTAATTAVTAAIEAERTYAAALLAAAGAGLPRGLTGAAQPQAPTPEVTAQRLTEALSRLGLDDKQAAVAAKGR